MILYVNGDSHTAAAEAVNPHAFAEDDGMFFGLGRRPHPDNERVSYGCELANLLNAVLECGAESASSNARIIRTSREWLSYNHADLVVVQWSTWEREEWLYNGTYYQVNASGTDHIPPALQEKYRHYILGIDWVTKTQQAHREIWEFHQELLLKNIPHIFFNGNNNFSKLTDKKDWGVNYINPYDPESTFDSIIRANGFDTVNPNSWHFGDKAHSFFAQFMLQYITNNNFI